MSSQYPLEISSLDARDAKAGDTTINLDFISSRLRQDAKDIRMKLISYDDLIRDIGKLRQELVLYKESRNALMQFHHQILHAYYMLHSGLKDLSHKVAESEGDLTSVPTWRDILRGETPSVPRHIGGILTLISWISAHTLIFAIVLHRSCAIAVCKHSRISPTKNYIRIVASMLKLQSTFFGRRMISLRCSTTIRLLLSKLPIKGLDQSKSLTKSNPIRLSAFCLLSCPNSCKAVRLIGTPASD